MIRIAVVVIDRGVGVVGSFEIDTESITKNEVNKNNEKVLWD